MTKEITVQGARAHNLKDVNVQIPKNKLVVNDRVILVQGNHL